MAKLKEKHNEFDSQMDFILPCSRKFHCQYISFWKRGWQTDQNSSLGNLIWNHGTFKRLRRCDWRPVSRPSNTSPAGSEICCHYISGSFCSMQHWSDCRDKVDEFFEDIARPCLRHMFSKETRYNICPKVHF